jgi:uncharacterized protein YcfJ
MKKSLAIAAVALTMMTGCQTSTSAQDFPLGPVLGGVAGGFIGNQFGKGNGKAAATALGAVGGVLLGQQLQRPVVNQAPAPAHVVVTSCDTYYNPGARAACNRGVADRNREYQRRVERQAYDIGRGQGYRRGWGRTVMPGGRITW